MDRPSFKVLNTMIVSTIIYALFACQPDQCPTSNVAFTADCEPAIPACKMGLEPRSAESYRGTFGSVSANGSCQSQWPEPILAACTEPLPEGVPDMRGLWADSGHVERVEQCGNLVIIVGDTYTHGGYATGLVDDGVNDFRGDGSCSTPIAVALTYEGDALQFLLNGETVVVTRTLETADDGGVELVWRYGPALQEVARMRRHCQLSDVPETAVTGMPGQ